jgi:UPF0176 protein
MNYQVLLFYKYTHITDPEAVMLWQRELCERLDLKGRLIIAKEGLNVTLEGKVENTKQYMKELKRYPGFQEIDFKRSQGTGNAFDKLSVKVRPEVVTAGLGENDINPNEVTGKHISPEELHRLIHSDEEFYIVDMRNDYEHKAGYFKDSILAPIGNFRELPQVLNEISHLKDKKIVTVCTGGVRCEKASGFLVNSGFSDVSQLDGGIVSYMKMYPNEDFLGKLYVFDNRMVMGFHTDAPEHQVVGKCELCGKSSENYVNCSNIKCHRHFICCAECTEAKAGNCGQC